MRTPKINTCRCIETVECDMCLNVRAWIAGNYYKEHVREYHGGLYGCYMTFLEYWTRR